MFLISQKDNEGKTQYIATQQYVTVGDTDGEDVIVTKGLKVGDQVVNAGQNKVTSGQEVAINNSIKLQ